MKTIKWAVRNIDFLNIKFTFLRLIADVSLLIECSAPAINLKFMCIKN